LNGRNDRESETAFRQARDLQERLVQESPDEVSYLMDLTLTCSRQGSLYLRGKRYDDAARAYERAIGIQDRLLERFPGTQAYRDRCGYYRLQMANVLEEKGDLDAALPLYRKAYEMLAELVRLSPGVPSHHTDLTASATSLGYALAERDPAEAAQ